MNKIARIVNGKIIYTDEHAKTVLPNEMEARARRQAMKTKFRKDLLQPNQTDYWRVHKKQAEEELPEETRRLLS